MLKPLRVEMIVRRASPDDIALIRSLADVAFRDTYREILSPDQLEYMMDWMYSEESLNRQMEEGHVYFIAERDGIPCGYLSVEPLGLQDDGDFLFELQKIYVLPDFQGQRIGGLLYSHALSFMRRSAGGHPARFELHVNRYNKAVNFYRHLGLEVLRVGDYPIGNGYFMNDYIMGGRL